MPRAGVSTLRQDTTRAPVYRRKGYLQIELFEGDTIVFGEGVVAGE